MPTPICDNEVINAGIGESSEYLNQRVREYESDSDSEDVWVDERRKGAFEFLDDFH